MNALCEQCTRWHSFDVRRLAGTLVMSFPIK
jgi:hypothetical protein